MKRLLTIRIDSGANTCCSPNKTLCRWLRISQFGTVCSCFLFSEQDSSGRWEALNEDENGWLLRHKECLKAEKSTIDLLKRNKQIKKEK